MMRYEGPVKQDKETISRVVTEGTEVSLINKAVLSAIFYHDAEFAADTLLQSLKIVQGDERIGLLRMTQTFMQVHKSVYLSTEFLSEMDGGAGVSEHLMPEVLGIRAALSELDNIYDGRTFHDMALADEHSLYVKLPDRSKAPGASLSSAFKLTEYAELNIFEKIKAALAGVELKFDLNIEGKITGVEIVSLYADEQQVP